MGFHVSLGECISRGNHSVIVWRSFPTVLSGKPSYVKKTTQAQYMKQQNKLHVL